MGFYLRKSLKAGPFRVNLSKSGIGVSTGVRGFRVGTGPRGNYVHMGRNGIYYRASLGGRPSSRAGAGLHTSPGPLVPVDAGPDPVIMEDITGATTSALAASSSSALLEEIQAASSRHRLWPWCLVVTLVAASAGGAIPLLGVAILVVGATGTWWVRQWDQARGSVVVFYDVNDQHAEQYQHLVDAFDQAASCRAAWQLTAEGDVKSTYQRKVNAGATSLVQRQAGHLDTNGPPPLVTNIAVPSLHTKGRALYLLPDRLLVRSGRTYAEVSWGRLSTDCTDQRFIESGHVPADSQIVDHTWKYVNKSGGPDKRFKDNRQLPIALYGEVELSSNDGFRAVWQLSRPDAASSLAKAVAGMT